jgi:hypothetical protein
MWVTNSLNRIIDRARGVIYMSLLNSDWLGISIQAFEQM